MKISKIEAQATFGDDGSMIETKKEMSLLGTLTERLSVTDGDISNENVEALGRFAQTEGSKLDSAIQENGGEKSQKLKKIFKNMTIGAILLAKVMSGAEAQANEKPSDLDMKNSTGTIEYVADDAVNNEWKKLDKYDVKHTKQGSANDIDLEKYTVESNASDKSVKDVDIERMNNHEFVEYYQEQKTNLLYEVNNLMYVIIAGWPTLQDNMGRKNYNDLKYTIDDAKKDVGGINENLTTIERQKMIKELKTLKKVTEELSDAVDKLASIDFSMKY